MTPRKKSISAAIDALAALYEHGALECAADPAGFVESVVADITALRATAVALLDATERAEKAEAALVAADALADAATAPADDDTQARVDAYRLARAEVKP